VYHDILFLCGKGRPESVIPKKSRVIFGQQAAYGFKIRDNDKIGTADIGIGIFHIKKALQGSL
jgi:hypothetical protein